MSRLQQRQPLTSMRGGRLKGIFISYRRDDAAGHAGRLFDGLIEHFGADHVFMDMSGLRPGQDFVVELDRALASCDYLLAVIGPRWLEAMDATGRRRLDNPNDLVRREVSTALAGRSTAIPVLVHGARMPAAEALPEPLKPLARRQAIELTDQRWESDLRDLVACLAADETQPYLRAPAATDTRSALAARASALMLVLGGVVAVIGAWFLLKPYAAEFLAVHEQGSAAASKALGAAATRVSIALPKVREVTFRTSRAVVTLSILAIRLAPRDRDTQTLTFQVRMLNQGPHNETFNSDQFRLLVGNQTLAPNNSFGGETQFVSARDAVLHFTVPADVSETTFQWRFGDESTHLPVSLTARTPMPSGPAFDEFGHAFSRLVDIVRPLPTSLPTGQRLWLGDVEYQIVDATLGRGWVWFEIVGDRVERKTVDEGALWLKVRCTKRHGDNEPDFCSTSVRLWVDGVPRTHQGGSQQPVGESLEREFLFYLVTMPATLEVNLIRHGDRVRVPLDLTSLLNKLSRAAPAAAN